jgi:hypothetical protein
VAPLFALDIGVLLDQNVGMEGEGAPRFSYSGNLMPWLTTPLGTTADLAVTLGLTLKYENENFSVAPELLRTQADWRINPSFSLKLGRIYHSDPLGLTAEGLFDGLSLGIDLGESLLDLGVSYTGLLYKKSANITLTQDEADEYNLPLDYHDFQGTYFAPRRLVASAAWSHPALADLFRLNVELLHQSDLNKRDTAYHSQYLIAKLALPFLSRFVLEAGGVVELIEATGWATKLALAGDLNFAYMLPTAIQDRLTLGGRYSSGTWEDSVISSFTPLTTKTQGHLLRAKFSGLSSITAAYTARLHSSFSVAADASYFFRNDLGTYMAWPVLDTSAYFLGGEIYAQLIWSPLSDVNLQLGGGAFFPKLGNTDPSAAPRWQVQLNVVLAVF